MLHIVTDFDGTLMHQDVGDEIMHGLGVLERPETKEVTRLFMEKKIGTAAWIKTAFAFLAGRQAEVDAIIRRMRVREGAFDFLRFCRERNVPVTILSDGMKYYIDRLLALHDIEVTEVISNPIGYGESGEFFLNVQNDNPACSWCGCCKAGTVRSIRQGGAHVVYIGDGISDVYGCGFADWVFARGSLAKYLDRLGEAYFPFETFHDVMNVLQSRFAEFASGQAAGRRNRENGFCVFA